MVDMNVQPMQRAALSVIEASRSASLGRSTLYQAIAEGRLRTLKIGNRRLIRPCDLSAWLEAHAVGPAVSA